MNIGRSVRQRSRRNTFGHAGEAFVVVPDLLDVDLPREPSAPGVAPAARRSSRRSLIGADARPEPAQLRTGLERLEFIDGPGRFDDGAATVSALRAPALQAGGDRVSALAARLREHIAKLLAEHMIEADYGEGFSPRASRCERRLAAPRAWALDLLHGTA